MKFAHLADCHIGSWRDQKIKDLSDKAFVKAVDICIEEKVDFVLISGDLFNTSLPSIERLKDAVIKLKQLKDKEIPVYIIPGSHDFSPSGKTMLDVLENAGLFVNVFRYDEENDKIKLKFTKDSNTEALITGIIGKKGMLDKSFYEKLDRNGSLDEPGFKIFMFHTALDQMKSKEFENMDSISVSLLPKNFNYYAGGHVHSRMIKKFDEYGLVVYPGPLFPNNFAELEKTTGGFYIYDEGELEFKPLRIINVDAIQIDCEGLTTEQVVSEIIAKTKNKEFINTIVLLRLHGTLASGKISDIDFKDIFNQFYLKGAYFVMKNTNKLQTKEFEEVKTDAASVDEVESELVKENIGQIDIDKDEKTLVNDIMQVLNTEKGEGELTRDFEERLKKELNKVFDV